MDNMIERGGFSLSEHDGWFILQQFGCGFPNWDGDLGRGGAEIIIRFRTVAERSYYIQIEYMRDTIGRLESEIRNLKTVSGANRNLREVRARKKVESNA